MKSKMFALALTAIMLTTLSANFFAEAQNQDSTQTLLSLTKQTKNQLDSLINQTYANETTLQTIEAYGLLNMFEGNISLYSYGVKNLTKAESQVAQGNYNAAQSSMLQALATFKAVFNSVNYISNICNPKTSFFEDAKSLLEANTRAQERITLLKTVIPKNQTTTLELLEQAKNCFTITSLNELSTQEQYTQTVARMQKGNILLAQVYQNIKAQSEVLNSLRLNSYCNSLIATIQEKLQYGNAQGVNIDEFMQSRGYQNSSDYISSLQQRIQEATNQQGNIQNKINSLNSLSEEIQNTDQALNQEIVCHGGTPNNETDGNSGNSNNPTPTTSAPVGGTNSTSGPNTSPGPQNGNSTKR
jgi:hypothetical protein